MCFKTTITNPKEYKNKIEYWMVKVFNWGLDYIRSDKLSYSDVQNLLNEWNKEQEEIKRNMNKETRKNKMRNRRFR